MSYTDNPMRPNLRYWFSPITMVDYLQNYNMDTNVANYFYMQPGDSYEAPLYTAKEAYAADHQHRAVEPSQRLGHGCPL